MSQSPTRDVAIVEAVWGHAFESLSTRLEVELIPDAWNSRQSLIAAAEASRCLVIRNRAMLDAEIIRAGSPSLELVARAGAGLDNIDLDAAEEMGIVVSTARGANARSVAEHAFGLALALARRIPALDRDTRAGGWDRSHGVELLGRTWGLLGVGKTGIEVARLAHLWGMDVIAFDPYVDPERPDLREVDVRLLPLDDVISASQVLSIHLPLTGETKRLLGADRLAMMRPEAFLINLGRGGIVDEAALAQAIEAGVIAGAALDVRDSEPPERSRLDTLDQVILTPHVAGLTGESEQRIVTLLAEEIERVLAGGNAEHAVGTVTRSRFFESGRRSR